VNQIRILGLTLFVVGIVLVFIGYDASDAPIDQLSDAMTGRFTDRTMWYLIVGGAAAFGGGLLAIFGRGAR